VSDKQDAKRKKAKNKGKRKAPGLMSFVVWRQFFMVLGAPGIATVIAGLYDAQSSFVVILIGAAVPSLIHGQLWKWTFDWAGRGATVLRNLRLGQIALGAVHSGLCIWALSQVALGAIPWGNGFYHGLTIAGLAAGLWETVRPALELKDPPEVKEAEERKRRRAAKKKAAERKAATKKKAEAAMEANEPETDEVERDEAPIAAAPPSEDQDESPSEDQDEREDQDEGEVEKA